LVRFAGRIDQGTTRRSPAPSVQKPPARLGRASPKCGSPQYWRGSERSGGAAKMPDFAPTSQCRRL
jgi:hypothetical protein